MSAEKVRSTQMIARDLRYQWLNELLDSMPSARLATAHHIDDVTETIMLGLIKGVGVSGLGGIPVVTGRLIRPLLFLTKEEIRHYANAEDIPFREDSSNQDPKYLRNRIRHELIPLIQELSGGSLRPLERYTRMMQELASAAEDLACVACCEAENVHWWPRDRFHGMHQRLVLNATIRGYDFHPDVIEQIAGALESETFGQKFVSADNELVLERDRLVIRPKVRVMNKTEEVENLQQVNSELIVSELLPVESFDRNAGVKYAWFDADLVKGGAELRPWRHGDRMQPWGMKGTKLISDLLNESRLPVTHKEAVYVLECDGRIIWLVGHRIAEGLGVSDSSVRILRLEWKGHLPEQDSKGDFNSLETFDNEARTFTSD